LKPNGLSGEDEQPSEDQSKVEGFWALRAAIKVEIVEEKRRRSVACAAVSWRVESSTGVARPRERREPRTTKSDFMVGYEYGYGMEWGVSISSLLQWLVGSGILLNHVFGEMPYSIYSHSPLKSPSYTPDFKTHLYEAFLGSQRHPPALSMHVFNS
jgi:hypothetical protein